MTAPNLHCFLYRFLFTDINIPSAICPDVKILPDSLQGRVFLFQPEWVYLVHSLLLLLRWSPWIPSAIRLDDDDVPSKVCSWRCCVSERGTQFVPAEVGKNGWQRIINSFENKQSCLWHVKALDINKSQVHRKMQYTLRKWRHCNTNNFPKISLMPGGNYPSCKPKLAPSGCLHQEHNKIHDFSMIKSCKSMIYNQQLN